jgi:hypothetical protein
MEKSEVLISHTFRGEEVDIDVTDKREPYEWLFYGKTPAEHDALNVTDAEELEIYQLIHNSLYERAACASGDE